MSCTDGPAGRTDGDNANDGSDGPAVVERHVELPASPDAVWEALAALLGDEVELVPAAGGRVHAVDDDGERVGVVHEAVPGSRLAFRWCPVGDGGWPSEVEIDLEPVGAGTLLHLRELRLDGEHLGRSAMRACAAVAARTRG